MGTVYEADIYTSDLQLYPACFNTGLILGSIIQ